jgi:hypothetical protein
MFGERLFKQTVDIPMGTNYVPLQLENRNLSFLKSPNCQCRGVCQYMKQTKQCLCYRLFQAQCDKCDQHNHQAELFSEKTSFI